MSEQDQHDTADAIVGTTDTASVVGEFGGARRPGGIGMTYAEACEIITAAGLDRAVEDAADAMGPLSPEMLRRIQEILS